MAPPDASINALPLRSARRPVARPARTGVVSERLRARERRITQIRRRVVALATAIFLATSGGIFVQLATGNDPALATSAAKTAATATTPTTAASTSSGAAAATASAGSSSSSTSAGSASSGSGNAAAVTTRQS
jgi:hypothetical protein